MPEKRADLLPVVESVQDVVAIQRSFEIKGPMSQPGTRIVYYSLRTPDDDEPTGRYYHEEGDWSVEFRMCSLSNHRNVS